MYFYFLAQYRVGDTIKIGTLAQGEIMFIEPLYIAIAEKNDDADHTGRLHIVTNKNVWDNPITRVTLSLKSYAKHVLRIAYVPEVCEYSF